MALFEKGNSGRPKGSKNKLTNDVRQIFHKVYEDMGGDDEITDPITGKKRRLTGHEAMLIWARGNPTEFYRLYGKMIPTTQEIQIDNHEDFLDDLVIEGQAEVKELETKAIDVTHTQPVDTTALSPQDVDPNKPDKDADLV
jgi:hypothetical protein